MEAPVETEAPSRRRGGTRGIADPAPAVASGELNDSPAANDAGRKTTVRAPRACLSASVR